MKTQMYHKIFSCASHREKRNLQQRVESIRIKPVQKNMRACYVFPINFVNQITNKIL